jgi:hypothetical protein
MLNQVVDKKLILEMFTSASRVCDYLRNLPDASAPIPDAEALRTFFATELIDDE